MKLYDEKLYHEYFERLVPDSGKCETLEGELLRAASRIMHDYNNNGFGNNWTGALNFLEKYSNVPSNLIKFLRPYAKGEKQTDGEYDENDLILYACNRIVVIVLDQIQRSLHPVIDLHPNPCDMLDLRTKETKRRGW